MSASSRPYLLRAIYEWLLDNNLTPHIVINTNMPGVEVPSSHIENGQLVLNISPDACRNLLMGDEEVTFSARFGGASRQILVPVSAVVAIYARENSQGMVFGQEPSLAVEDDALVKMPKAKDTSALDTKTADKTASKKMTHLKVIK